MKDTIGTVLTAAEVRADQWRAVAEGKLNDSIIDELWEAGVHEGEFMLAAVETAIKDFREAEYIPFDHAEVALCIWEYAIQASDKVERWLTKPEGVVNGRQNAVKLAPFFNAVWAQAQRRGFDAPFDWDLVPPVLQHLVETYAGPEVLTIEDHAHLVAEKFMEDYR